MIADADLEALVSDELSQAHEVFTLDGMQVACGTMGMPTATVRLRGPGEATQVAAAIGTGPVDATYKAIDAIVQVASTLLEFNVHAITEGIDALGRVTVRIEAEAGEQAIDAQRETERRRTFGGYGADTDIIVAAAKAYLSALNKLLFAQRVKGQPDVGVSLATLALARGVLDLRSRPPQHQHLADVLDGRGAGLLAHCGQQVLAREAVLACPPSP